MKQKEDKKSVALSYFTVAEKFLRLSILSTKELIISGNVYIITSREKITYEKLEEETKWSDLNISIPILFNFYHGIELVLKGILISGNIKITKIHKLTKLINKANRLKLEDSELIKTIRSVTTELPTGSFLYDFFQEYGIDD